MIRILVLSAVFMMAINPLMVVAAPQTITADELIRALSSPQKTSQPSKEGWKQGARNFQIEAYLKEEDSAKPIESEDRAISTSSTESAPPSIDLSVPFVINQAKLTSQGHQMVNIIAQALKSEQLITYRFLIEGHTDSSGHEELNRRLSLQRAQSVKAQLIKQGVNTERLDVIGRAADEPLDLNNPYAAENRRVKLIRLENTSSH